MTFLVYQLWLAAMLLVAGELDRFLAGLFQRLRWTQPQTHWAVALVSSALLPGLGQFLNGQPLKALFLVTWPFLAANKAPVPPPWQMFFLRPQALLLPWWLLAMADALISGLILSRRRALQMADTHRTEAQRSLAIEAFLNRRKAKTPPPTNPKQHR